MKVSQSAITDLSDIFSTWDKRKSTEEKEFIDDILVLSCTLHRIKGSGIVDIQDPRLVEFITNVDKEKANDIRNYYKSKLMMRVLKNKNLSEFRKDLNKFLYIENPSNIPEKYIGLVYKLPLFYDYDQEFDDIFKSSYYANKKDNTMNNNEVRELTYIKKIKNVRGSITAIEYWFNDKNSNKVMLRIPIDNQLLPLFDEKLNNKNLKIVSKYCVKYRDNIKFFSVDKWEFVNENI